MTDKSYVASKVMNLVRFYGQVGKVENQVVSEYVDRLSKFDKKDIDDAIDRVKDECKFFPSYAEIKERLPKKSGIQIYNEIFGASRNGLGRNSRLSEVKAKLSPDAYAALEMIGGWLAYCDGSSDRNIPALQKACNAIAKGSSGSSMMIESRRMIEHED